VSQAGDTSVVALITHARHVPATDRKRFGERLRERPARDLLVLETCHRVEAYVVGPRDVAGLAGWLPDGGQLLTGQAAIRHAIAVAVGRDSVVIGEDQVLQQLREAVAAARADDGFDPVLERLFGLALRAGRQARSWRQGPARSLADLALTAIEQRCGSLREREILVVGAGKMGRLAVRAAIAAGASVSIANRSGDTADAVAAQNGVRVEAFDPGPRIEAFAGIVVALGGPWAIGPATVEGLVASSSVVVDLSVPAALPRAAAEVLGARFVSADALAIVDPESGAATDASRSRVEALVDATVAEFVGWLEGREGRAAARALTERADREREAELNELWRRMPDLAPETRDAIERMTRHLAARLLREPLERLGRDPDGRAERAARDLFAL
jgi:glutamyl-tRNA reductase